MNNEQKIKLYKKCIDKIIRNPYENNYVCIIIIYELGLRLVNEYEYKEFLLFREQEYVNNNRWLTNQICHVCYGLKGKFILYKDKVKLFNEYRIFILQLCIEMLKDECIEKRT